MHLPNIVRHGKDRTPDTGKGMQRPLWGDQLGENHDQPFRST